MSASLPSPSMSSANRIPADADCTQAAPKMTSITGWHLVIVFTCYFTINAVLRILVSGSLERDEGVQVVMGGNWQWGYGPQPPLYTWVQSLFFEVFGMNVFALALMKNSLLMGFFVTMMSLSRRIFKSGDLVTLVTVAFFLIPGISWESQRDLTDTVMATVTGGLTLYYFLLMQERRDFVSYVLLGLFCGLSILSKYNALLFLFGLFCAALFAPRYREVIRSPRILITLLITLIVVSPHFIWALTNPDLLMSSEHKFRRTEEFVIVKSFSETVLAILEIVGPLVIVAALFSARQARQKLMIEPDGNAVRFILLVLGLCSFLCLAVAMGMGVTSIKGRWLQPVLFAVPIPIMAFALERMSLSRQRLFLMIVCIAAIAVPSFLFGRVLFAEKLDAPTDWNEPYPAFASELRKAGFDGGVIVADDMRTGGSLRLHFKDSTVLVAGKRATVPERFKFKNEAVLIVWRPELEEEEMAWLFELAAKNTNGALPADIVPKTITAPYLYMNQRQAKLRYILLPANFDGRVGGDAMDRHN